MREEINSVALVMLIQDHWDEFVEYCMNEESAEETLKILQKDSGMACEPANPR